MNNNLFCFHLQQGLQGQRVSDYNFTHCLVILWEKNIEEVFHHHLLIERLNTNHGDAVIQSFRALLAPVDHQDHQ